ncbi:hypothetical protein [Actinophytocola algeriensis]|uniref:Uncharacterized protein n=1 Tax=Actinophytocola algeriensis TaxID=1768010 RepID=A0A7W7PZ33_9PSEU|nr:hypothetical protein [Actinophytocola algeriensis]MBB4903843.1 hypothetical protein [Actinophytocola algeriensis]MBE1477300.1 hypothetical protein [Actinophytocola algeriensis]
MNAVILTGANPGARLTDGDVVTAFASVWTVDWSVRGAGTALVLWHGDRVRAVGSDPALAEWLAQYFVRHFPEVDGLPWPAPEVDAAPVTVELDLTTGLTARGGGVEVSMSDVLGRRTFATDSFSLDGVPHSLQLLLAPVAEAAITVDGHRVPGTVTVGGTEHRPSSSAFLATAEVWSV